MTDTLTPVQGIGQLRLIAAQARGNEDTTRQTCPLCKGDGSLEQRTETERGYAIRWGECWLCLGLCMVTPEVYVHYARWADAAGDELRVPVPSSHGGSADDD